MTDDETKVNANDLAGPSKPEQIKQQPQRNEASVVARPEGRTTPGRLPLFRR